MDALERMQHAESFMFIRNEEGGYEAHEYLKDHVAPDDRPEVLRDVMIKTRIAKQAARAEDERLSAKAEELGCSIALVLHIERMEKRIEDLVDLVAP